LERGRAPATPPDGAPAPARPAGGGGLRRGRPRATLPGLEAPIDPRPDLQPALFPLSPRVQSLPPVVDVGDLPTPGADTAAPVELPWAVDPDGLVRRPPRAPIPWDFLPAPLVLIDLETTGVNPRRDRIIEIAAIRYEPGQPTLLLDSLVRTEGLEVGPTHVHGIVPEMLADAPTFAELLPALRAVAEGATMVAHNASFEHGFLTAELDRAGGAWGLPRLCTVRLSQRLHSDRPKRGGHRLGELARHYSVPVVAAHRALGDVVMMAHLLIRMLGGFGFPEQLPRLVLGEVRPASALPRWPAEIGAPVRTLRRGPLA
jgi:DNA polymerase III epsilon subunit-like protein